MLDDYLGEQLVLTYGERGTAHVIAIEDDKIIAYSHQTEEILILSPLWPDEPVGDSPLIGEDEHGNEIHADIA